MRHAPCGAEKNDGIVRRLARPRSRTALNHDAAFKEIRNAVVGYLNTVRDESREIRKATRAKPTVALPKLEPIDLRVT